MNSTKVFKHSLPATFLYSTGFSEGIQQICDSVNDVPKSTTDFEDLVKFQQTSIEKFIKTQTCEQTKHLLKNSQASLTP